MAGIPTLKIIDGSAQADRSGHIGRARLEFFRSILECCLGETDIADYVAAALPEVKGMSTPSAARLPHQSSPSCNGILQGS
jgi:hypothetical protein